MIEKKRPRKLNSTKDSRVRGADEMYDAYNINVSTDHDASSEGGPGGDAGVIKPADGNGPLLEFEGIPAKREIRVVSSFLDDQHDIIYYFVWCDFAEYQGIYAYDTRGFFPEQNGNSNKVKLVYRTRLFNFDSDRYIKADLVVLSKEHTVFNVDYDVDPVIYFTDGKSEPRKIHVLDAYKRVRSTTGKDYDVDDSPLNTISSLPGNLTARYESFDTQDYIHACPKTPVHSPKAFFTNDPLSRVSNFENISGLQFAYQYIYDTGEESAISSYSDIIVPNGYVQQGARPSANLSLDNICVVRIPLYKKWQEEESAVPLGSPTAKTSDFAARYIPKNVKSIRILGREGNLSSFFVIDTVDNPMFYGSYPHEYLEYQFRNDRIKRGFSKTEAQKPYDATPLTAGTQVAASNRMMYGDYVVGYDNVDVYATATVNYKERGGDFKTIDINVSSTIDFLETSQEPNYVNDRKAAIVFDVSDFPEDSEGLPKDSQVDIIITLRPKRNWHIYNAKNSFHGSRHIGNTSGATIEGSEATADNDILPWEVGPNLAGDGLAQVGTLDGAPGLTNSSRSRTLARANKGLNDMWGDNTGVNLGVLNGGAMPRWKTVGSQFESVVGGNGVQAVFGTSAANPFILRGRPLLFQLSFKVIRDGLRGSDYKAKLKDYIQRVLGGIPLEGIFYPTTGESPFFETLYVNREFEYTINEGLDGGSSETTQEEASSGENNKIDVVSDGDDRKHLIIAVGNRDKIYEKRDSPEELRGLTPCGYIIVNKARPRFSLRARGALSDGSNYGVLQINLDRIGRFDNPDDVEILTAIPFINSDQWIDKGMVVNPGNYDEQNGADNTRQWYNSFGLIEAGASLTTAKNWGLYDVSTWQFETKVVDSWWCFSKEFMVRNTVPSFLFTDTYSDYARYANGAFATQDVLDSIGVTQDDGGIIDWQELVDDAASWLGVDSLDAIETFEEAGQILSDAAYGLILSKVTNGGRLKNAAVIKDYYIKQFLLESADSGVFTGFDQLEDLTEAITDDGLGGVLHFRHNATGYVGGDGLHTCTLSPAYDPISGGGFGFAGRGRIIGWLDSGESWLSDVPQRIYAGAPQAPDGTPSWENGFTTLDGAGGIGSSPGGGEARLRYDVDSSCAMGSVNGMMIFHGYIGPRSTFLPTALKNGSKPAFGTTSEIYDGTTIWNMHQKRYDPYINSYGQDCMMPFLGQFNYLRLNILGNGDVYGYRWLSTNEIALNDLDTQTWPGDVSPLYYTTPLDITNVDDGGQILLSSEDAQNENHDWRTDYELTSRRGELLPEILDVGGGTLLGDELKSGWRSFKTRANHDFGIVFYDERGRAGRVNPIVFNTTNEAAPTNDDGAPIFPTYSSSIYVAGYDERDNKGNVSINIQLDQETTPPPSWARHYQIVYGGNSSKSNFVQYVTGGAFVAIGDEESAEEVNTNIYVSLNYLQGNKDVSYAEAFGAVNPQGAKQMYTYSPGDKLRVISYYDSFDEDNPRSNRNFPIDYEFEIVGLEVLSSNPEDNPIHRSFASNNDQAKMSDAKSGQFLVLKNNPFASGFTFNDVKNGQNEESTSQHYWNNICVVEIYSPTRESADQEEKLYYEISRVYDVGTQNGNKYYKTNPILLERGDVWWRQVPLAVPKFSNGEFENLIKYNVEEEKSSQPRFQPYWLETKTFNDTFAGNNVLGRGKPNIIDDEFGQKRNRSGVIYSDVHSFDKSKNRFSSFNAVEGNYKIFPGEYGKIEHLINNYDSLIMFQENKVSSIPVERSILSTADGSNSLVQSTNVLGIQSFYAGDYGTGGNPESVLKKEGYIFFASKQNSEVYRLTTGGAIEVISSLGLKNDFYNVFESVNNQSGRTVWIPTGYDPINDEFLVTIEAITRLATANAIVPNGQNLGEAVADGGEDVTSNDPEVIGGCSDPDSDNYSVFATGEDNDGTCVYLGCTRNTAVNFNPDANKDCDNSVYTQIDGFGQVPNPTLDCLCRDFEPCIFDTLSETPNGGVNYQDIIDFENLVGTDVEVPAGSTENNFAAGNFVFEDDILRLIGLDFAWALNLDPSEIPPTSLNSSGGQVNSWTLGGDTWGSDALYFAIAKYTEGPPAPDLLNPQNTWDTITQRWYNSSQLTWWDGLTPGYSTNILGTQINFDPVQISDGYWVTPETLGTYNQNYITYAQDGTYTSDADTQEQIFIPNENTNPNDPEFLPPPKPFWEVVSWNEYDPSGNGCEFIGCADSNALNYQPGADQCVDDDSGGNVDGVLRLALNTCGWFPDNVSVDINTIENLLIPYDGLDVQTGTNVETGNPRVEIVAVNASCCEFWADYTQPPLSNAIQNFTWDPTTTEGCSIETDPGTYFIHSCIGDAFTGCDGYSRVNVSLTATEVNGILAANPGVSNIGGFLGWPQISLSLNQLVNGDYWQNLTGARVTTEDDGGVEFYNITTTQELNALKNFMNGAYNNYISSIGGDTLNYEVGSTDNNIYCTSSEFGFDCDETIPIFFVNDEYVYWDSCCQYKCNGYYPTDSQGNPVTDIDGQSVAAQFTQDFISQEIADELALIGIIVTPGPRACYDRVYLRDEWEGQPRPEDYDPT